MKLCIYQCLDSEKVLPDDVTHVIVDGLVSVIMGDNVMRIGREAFTFHHTLLFVQFSRTLQTIGECAFCGCESLEALFLPSTVKSIEGGVLLWHTSLRLLVLPNDIDLSNVVYRDIECTAIHQIAETTDSGYNAWNVEIHRRVDEWLDEALFHNICFFPSQQNGSMTTTNLCFKSMYFIILPLFACSRSIPMLKPIPSLHFSIAA